MVTLDGTGIEKEASTWSTWEYVYYKTITPAGRYVSGSTVPNIISNQTYAVSYHGIKNADKAGLISFTGNGRYLEWTSSEETLAEEQARLSLLPMQVVYELATPITYQLTAQEIEALVGTNNVWSDGGNVTVAVVTPETLTNNGRAVVPTLTASADMVLKWGNYSASVQQGTSTIPQLILENGANLVYIIGTGSISFTWQEASL